MKRNKIFLSLGSNLGDKKEKLKSAVNHLKDILINLCCSSIYETEPIYVLDQPYFYNILFIL